MTAAQPSYPYLNNNDDRKRRRPPLRSAPPPPDVDTDDDDAMGSSSRSEDDGPGAVNGNGAGPSSGGNGNGGHLAVPDSNGGNGENSRGGPRPYSPVAETLFRKDLISAMKLPDNEPLTADDYLSVTDTWKQEWEKGVQVPAKPEQLKEPHVSKLKQPPQSVNRFQFPRKLLCMNQSGVYTSSTHQVTPMALRSEQVCSYDLDDVDQRWLAAFNGERALSGAQPVSELEVERVVEELERQCWEKIHSTLKSNEEADDADDGVICDVCRSPDSEECNVMVFCEKCNICVHQACYGITSIPSGPWVCKTCSLGIKPKCELCPNRGGAMKSTKSGQKWAHVSCALWIPEVSIGCVEKMEPITKISSIPQSRWNLVCVLCKERVGSCIQCSVKTCKTAYHVTCAFKRGLEMRAIIEDENAEDGVKLRSYCQKHSLNQKRRDSEDSDDDGKKKHMTAEERSLARREKLIRIEAEFYKHVDLGQAARKTGLDCDLVDFVFRYWLLKRKAGGNKPLLAPRSEQMDLLSVANQETEREKMKRFVALRQDLERVRNLCYMVSRREKLQRSWVKLREQILAKQLHLLADKSSAQQMSLMEMSAVLEANHGPTVYDRLFSHEDAEQHSEGDFEVIVARISGAITENSAQRRKDRSAAASSSSGGADGGSQNALGSGVSYERIFSDMSASETDDILNISATFGKEKGGAGARGKGRPGKRGGSSSRGKGGRKATSSATAPGAKKGSRKPMTRSESSDLSPDSDDDSRRKSKAKAAVKSSIFSDTDSEDSKSKMPKAAMFRTKAAMKDFSVDELTRSRKGKEKAKAEAKSKASSSGPGRGRPKKVEHSASSEDSDSDSDTERRRSGGGGGSAAKAAALAKARAEAEAAGALMIVPERAAARKAAAKLKAGEQRVAEVTQPEIYDFDAFDTVVNNIPKDVVDALREPPKSYVPPATSSHLKSSTYKRLFEDSDSDLSDLGGGGGFSDIYADPKLSKTKKGKKGKMSASSAAAAAFAFVPERKAAKKASAHLKDGGRTGGSAAAASSAMSATSAREESPDGKKKSPGRPRKKDHGGHRDHHHPSMSERIRLSDSDSDQEPLPFPAKSPRGKSPRGRGGAAPKSPKKPSAASARASAAGAFPKPRPVKNKALSSTAAAFLSQRESQLDDIFEECGLGSKKSKKDPSAAAPGGGLPDKKLKTSEGRSDLGAQSPEAADSSSRQQRRKSSSDSSSSDSSSSSSSSSSEDDGPARTPGRKEADKRKAPQPDPTSASPGPRAAAAAAAAPPGHKEESDSPESRHRRQRLERDRDRGRLRSGDLGAGAGGRDLHSPLSASAAEAAPAAPATPASRGLASPAGSVASSVSAKGAAPPPAFASPRSLSELPGGGGRDGFSSGAAAEQKASGGSVFSPSRSPFADKESPGAVGGRGDHLPRPRHGSSASAASAGGEEASVPKGGDGKHPPQSPHHLQRQRQQQHLQAQQHQEVPTPKAGGLQAPGSPLKSPRDKVPPPPPGSTTAASTTSQPKQTDDSGFDSDEKAQQNQQKLAEERLNAQKQNHFSQQQQHMQQQQQGGRGGQQWNQMQQQQQQGDFPPSLANMDPYQREQAMQSEAFYNYVYDMQRKMGMNPAQMAAGYGSGGQQGQQHHNQQQQHAMQQQMKEAFQNFGNMEWLQQLQQYNPHQYQQYYQQYMQQMQLYGASGSNNHLKELQMLEQLFGQAPWSGAATGGSSWQNLQSAAGKMAMAQQQHPQHLQKQQQAHQKHQTSAAAASGQASQPPTSAASQSSSSYYNYNREASNSTAPYSSSGDQYSSAAKVQSSSAASSSSMSQHHRRSSKESPGRRPAQSPRGGGPAHYQHDHSNSSASAAAAAASAPSATPADALPGNPGSAAHKDKTAEQQQQDFAISKDLLGEVAGLNKLPVWKPGSERDSSGSPRKTPDARRASNDKNFEDLVRTGPQQQQRLAQQRQPQHTPSAHSESKESVSDYDDMKGGVDYDDYDLDDDYYQQRTPAPAKKRARGRPRGAAGAGRGRGRGRPKAKPAVIDHKGLEAVHKAVAGTDYDFEDEFGDDGDAFGFGGGGGGGGGGGAASKKKEPAEFSLQALREQTKRNNLMLDAKKEDELAGGGGSASFDFDDELDEKEKPASKTVPPVRIAKPRGGRGAASRGRGAAAAAGRGRGRGGGRGRPKKTPSVEPSSPVSSEAPEDSRDEDFTPPPPAASQPPLPKLKLGALLIKKDSPKGSPKPSKSKSKHKDKEVKVVPKLKIKFGKPPPKAEPKEEGKAEETAPATPKESEDQQPSSAASTADKKPIADEPGAEKKGPVEALAKEQERSATSSPVPKTSSPASPSKKVSKIDMLANKLMDAKSSTSSSTGAAMAAAAGGGNTNDVAAIFGPSKPLDMSAKAAAGSDASSAAGGREEKSELDLLQEEMKNLQQKPGAAAASSSAVTAAPASISSSAAESVPPKKRDSSATVEDDYESRGKHFKFKFKRHTATPDPSASSAPPPAPAASAAPAASQPSAAPPDMDKMMQSVHPRMRKKEILSKYFGGDVYPNPPPSSASSSSGGGAATTNNGPTPSSQQPSEPPAQPAPRSFIKMPKAVASVTSVPTRADYQQQLDANMERKRKLKGLESGVGGANEVGAGGKGQAGKKKKGRPRNDADDGDFKSKSVDAATKKESGGAAGGRKTRGKPPKKCLAEDVDNDVDSGDFKAESMKYAERMRASFETEEQQQKPAAKKGRPRKGATAAAAGAKRKNAASAAAGGKNAKAPRLVIKFSKESKKAEEASSAPASAGKEGPSDADRLAPGGVDSKAVNNDKSASTGPSDGPPPASSSSEPPPPPPPADGKKNNGLDEYNFSEESAAKEGETAGGKETPPPPMVDGNVELSDSGGSRPPSSLSSSAAKVPKLRIKI